MDGPDGLTTDITDWDFVSGGRWAFEQTEPGGQSYGFRGTFHTVRTDELAIQTFEFLGFPDVVSIETLRFVDLGDGRTRLEAHAVYPSIEARDGMVDSGMEHGVTQATPGSTTSSPAEPTTTTRQEQNHGHRPPPPLVRRQRAGAAEFYVSVFPNSRITNVIHAPADMPGVAKGAAFIVQYELDGQRVEAISAGPYFQLTERSRSSSSARTRPRSTTTGTRCSPAAARRASAAGSRTASACPGRWSPSASWS